MSHLQKNFQPPFNNFSHHNETELSFADNNDAICICMQVSRDALLSAIANGCNTVKALSVHTGAGTVCGGCVATIATMIGEQTFQPAVCTQVVARTRHVKSFRFDTNGPQHALTAQPGQHVMLKATIGGVEVCRPYTVTAHASVANNAVYEITVLRQSQGAMSNWLFDHMRLNRRLEIALPSGESRFTINEKKPLIFLVGGIGVTPALAFCRALSGADLGVKSMRSIHVEYSVSTRNEAVCAEELDYLAARISTLTITLRVTSEHGRLASADIHKLVTQHTRADWFICGTPSFGRDIKAMLIGADVNADDIHVESFSARPGDDTEITTLTAWLKPAQRAMTSSFVLWVIGGYLLQGIANIQWPVLTALHANTAVNIFTGMALVVFFILQGQLGFVRAQNNKDDKSATARAYGKHILLGPLPLVALWLHSTAIGTALTFWLTTCLLASLATGAVIGMRPRARAWENTRKWLLGGHIFLSCATCGLGMVHGLIALWF